MLAVRRLAPTLATLLSLALPAAASANATVAISGSSVAPEGAGHFTVSGSSSGNGTLVNIAFEPAIAECPAHISEGEMVATAAGATRQQEGIEAGSFSTIFRPVLFDTGPALICAYGEDFSTNTEARSELRVTVESAPGVSCEGSSCVVTTTTTRTLGGITLTRTSVCHIPGGSCESTESEADHPPAPSQTTAASHVLAPGSYRPTHRWCPTNRTCFAHVTWTTYTGTHAVGYGPAKDCAGGGGPCRSDSHLTVALSAPRRVCGALRFTRLRMFGKVFRLDDTLDCATYQD